ncbi:metallophosphoesterase family protein [Methylibium petroleiphilum]|uniref:metallophosphoesterase family protein n=1 Tax=Methylibium petroleiphilum TaxID=105560 RepID=UPI001AC412DC|nr:metallophosphatase family protein [Methylibium petroleiphilum]MBN9206168.1 metallophosphatase family protein [Methylibium petroleiphilum]
MTSGGALRVAHFSDLHYGPRNLAEADRCFGVGIERAAEFDVDVAVISGDSTDHALDLHSPSAVALVSRVRRLADHCPVLMLQGTWSHEPPGTLSVFRALGGRHAVHVADRIGQVGLTTAGDWVVSPEWCFDALPEGLVALFSCLPSVNRAAVAATLGAADAAGATGEHVETLLRGVAPSHAMARQLGLPTLLVSHGTVFGCATEHGVPMAGFDHEFTTGSLFDAGAQAVLLGHIHRHQCWERNDGEGRRCIAYAGSIGRFHHGEAGDKGFLLWQVGPNSAACRLEATPARRTVDICFDGKPDLAALRTALVAQPVEGAWVRLRWSVPEEERNDVDRAAMRELLAGAAGVQFEGRIVPVIRVRSGGIGQAGAMRGKVGAWAGVVGARPETLWSCLDELATNEMQRILDDALAEPQPAVTVDARRPDDEAANDLKAVEFAGD